ncbi:MAG: tRNA pseudouridine(55) synthase TruB [Nitrospirae bacterium GWB2_47_37]|nr:MAG: tRNA pseudouridine(55) synthase TruB [Nitrospirae bacterium GWA2_46_11]OGW25243.1 MAG: tRNA pseudouridine(55) synthase TruB [Nitrospirae bacterium GWB2_47_37]HAK89535.1 tRNA pseudouridine(55) synthase TruB [Nitrospiraceae bacterium]
MNIVISLDKDHGITSHDAVTAVKKLFKVRKAGHAGTLDPIATGLLLICTNEATKIAPFLSGLDKEYIVTMKLGESTDTYDSEGRVIKQFEISNLRFQMEDIKGIVQKFTGEIEQIPPMYSAIKFSGKPLYKLARAGVEVERKPRKVTINAAEIAAFEPPFVTLKVSCSKGTYMRSLCNDIGESLGVGAHMTGLIRTRIGNFTIENSARISELPGKTSAMFSMDDALSHLPEITLDGEELKRVKNGNPIPLSLELSRSVEEIIRLKDPDGRLLGIGKVAGDSIKIERLIKI